jgi:hypothetical protein
VPKHPRCRCDAAARFSYPRPRAPRCPLPQCSPGTVVVGAPVSLCRGQDDPSIAPWRREYRGGAGFEVYRVLLTPSFEGRLYSEVGSRCAPRARAASRPCCAARAGTVSGCGAYPFTCVLTGRRSVEPPRQPPPLHAASADCACLAVCVVPARQVVHKAYEQLGVVVIALEMYSRELRKVCLSRSRDPPCLVPCWSVRACVCVRASVCACVCVRVCGRACACPVLAYNERPPAGEGCVEALP